MKVDKLENESEKNKKYLQNLQGDNFPDNQSEKKKKIDNQKSFQERIAGLYQNFVANLLSKPVLPENDSKIKVVKHYKLIDGIFNAEKQSQSESKKNNQEQILLIKHVYKEIAAVKERLESIGKDLAAEHKKLKVLTKKESSLKQSISTIDKRLNELNKTQQKEEFKNSQKQKPEQKNQSKKKNAMGMPSIDINNRGEVDPVGNFKENYNKNYKRIAQDRAKKESSDFLKNLEQKKNSQQNDKAVQKKVKI